MEDKRRLLLMIQRAVGGGWMWRREGRGGAGVEEQEGLVGLAVIVRFVSTCVV